MELCLLIAMVLADAHASHLLQVKRRARGEQQFLSQAHVI